MIEIKNLFKKFGDKQVLTGVNLTIPKGETIVIVGRSGCGKSVLLKLIVGLLSPDNGQILVEGNLINELGNRDLYSIRRKFGFLFQGAALFDSMTVGENISLPLVEAGDNYDEKLINREVEGMLDLVGLPGIQSLKPSELSGGMKKRVGLARALISKPQYILYDEPTTGLDPIMSDSIDRLIHELNSKLKVTSIVVTHDMFSVKNVADKVAMMHEGKIYFVGKPDELLNSSDNVIYDFIKRTETI
ncbi:MAG TPA: ABC transporter ATP-binding protein [Ignavibacteriaceae bacterium]|jgi:phospholipid/cholesterol/gamma-HCH transport system ATP-binding protein|nr:ABC transporter ATP-binding protein [Ignavibacteriaceae bacterium]HOJ17006.1 ABC transporter ATP-binding protein [Ignavibacteriaceae bacterium]